MADTDYGQYTQESLQSSFNAQTFFVWQILAKINTVQLVEVMNVTNDGELSPVGFVDVRPMTNQMTGDRKAVSHETIYGLPYFRLQGGANAVIIDPQVGDIGMCGFAQRDISIVKKTKAQANPGSYRLFDWADGLYLGGMLNGTPTQYVRFSAAGLELHSPVKVLITAPTVEIDASAAFNVTSPLTTITGPVVINGGLAVTGTYLGQTFSMTGPVLFHNATMVADGSSTFTFGGHRIDQTHTHGGVQTGGGTSGAVT